MPPRKKPTSASKKSNQNQLNSEPPKYGIQHFFERHTQNSQSQNPKRVSGSGAPANPVLVPHKPKAAASSEASGTGNCVSKIQTRSHGLVPGSAGSDCQNPIAIGSHCSSEGSAIPAVGNTKSGNQAVSGPSNVKKNEVNKETNGLSRDTPPENLLPVDNGNQSEVSPEVSKFVPAKRFKFSPGMLIKQSQDDGGDEITWKISPVNDRLHAVSKQLPEAVKILADSSRLNSLSFEHCKDEESSPRSPGKLEKWLSSPPLKPAEKSAMLLSRMCLKRSRPHQSVDFHQRHEGPNKKNASITDSQSPFTTPPSLSYCQDKPADFDDSKRVPNQPGPQQHKKALLELLDQVEDVISVDDQTCEASEAYLTKVQKDGDRLVKSSCVTKNMLNDPSRKVNTQTPNLHFLVLEVSENHGAASSGSQSSFKVLRLVNEQSGEERAVHLWDEWCYCAVAPGDTIHVIGKFDEHGKCDVNHEENYIIVHPDILVSGTRVSGSFSCPRRTVLDERLKCNDQSAAALTGTLLHQIFQAGLVRDMPTKEFLEEYARVILQKNIENLYACGVHENELHKTLIDAIPRILNWIFNFRDSQESRVPTVKFGSNDEPRKITVTEVIDIEEMAWAPKYGLKGMIDASLRVNVNSSINSASEKIMPLEFKTGKATTGQSLMEHSAQVMLYTLLMSDRYMKTIDSGLLYYLHTDQTQGISVRRSDLVGLIIRRNDLASDLLKASASQRLPPMLQSPSMCRGCRHLNACTVYHKAHGGNAERSGLGDIYDSLVHHLTSTHCAFLRQWERLVDLEAIEAQNVKKNMWSSGLSKKSASCLSSVILDNSEKLLQKNFSKGNRFVYRFVCQDLSSFGGEALPREPSSSAPSPTDDINCALRCGDYVILSTEPGCVIVASGIIMDIDRSQVTVSFSKRLRLPGSSPSSVEKDLRQEVWRIDKDEFMSSFAVMRFNLVQLFLQNDRSSHLRSMVVDLEAPRFDSGCIFSQDPAISYIWSEKNLNDDQRRAIIKILTMKDYALILGMPGTGKTSTMVHAVKALLMRGASILLTSYTNSAVDNLLIKLKAQGIDFLRIGRDDAVNEDVRENCFSAMDIRSVKDVKARLDQTKVVAVTCLGINSPLLINKRFDVCIMDEAGQITLPVSLGPLMYASKFVLVGDHYQLPPLVQSTEALENGMGVSLFCRLSEAHPQAISALQSQYRMNGGIMELSNDLIYGNRLRCGSSAVENARLKYSSSIYGSSWLKAVLDPNRPVIFINTDLMPALEEKDGKTINNPIEAKIIVQVTDELLKKGIEVGDIGVITPYNAQVNLIRSATSTSVETHTIDKYQGRDKDCILISFVRSNESHISCVSSLIGDWHRVNVAVTRAKKKLIMVGSCRTLSKVPLLKLLVDKVNEQSGIFNLSNADIKTMSLKRCSQAR